MSLIEKIQAQQTKRQKGRDVQEMADEVPSDVESTTTVASSKSVPQAPLLNVQAERQTRQLGYRVSVDTIYRFEAYRDKLNALARRKGLQRQSFGELAELALLLLMEHEPAQILGVK
jgi:hypothetical protein